MLLEFLFITLLEIYSKNYFKIYSKNYSNYYYYFSINPIPYGERSSTNPFGFLFVFFFSVRTTFKFFKFCFYALKCFLANFQGYSVFRSKVIPNCKKKSVKKGQKLSKSKSDKKGHIKLPFFFWLKSFILSRSKILQSFKPITFMVLERSLGWSYLIC